MSETKTEIEFETVTVKVPKIVMDFLRKTEENATEWIESTVVENVAAEIEGMKPQEWADLFSLTPVFKEVLGNAYYQLQPQT
jgi:hypothetical protein